VNSEMKNELQKKGIERLEDIRFWLAVLRNFDQFTEPQKQKIDQAYRIINKVYESFEPEAKPGYIVNE